MLAGIGLAALRRRAGAPRLMTATAVVLLVLVNIEAVRAPFHYRPFDGIPGIYKMLAKEPGPVVLVEVPFYPRARGVRERRVRAELDGALAAADERLQRLYANVVSRIRGRVLVLSGAGSVDAMKAAGATHLVVHPDRFGPERHETLQRALADPRLERMAVGRNNITLFRIK